MTVIFLEKAFETIVFVKLRNDFNITIFIKAVKFS